MSIDLGSALIRFREDIGLTRKELYEKVGISKFRLSQLENNNNKNSERAIKNILTHFDIHYSDFLIVYAGVKLDGKSFNSLAELKKYKENRPTQIENEPFPDDKIDYEVQRMIDNIDYLQNEATIEETDTIMDLIDFYKFKKYDKKDYQKWLVERSKEQK